MPANISKESQNHASNPYLTKIYILINNTALRHRMTLLAKETAKQFYSDIAIEKTITLYKKIVTARPPLN